MKTRVYSLCPECSECPELVMHEDGTVTLGEGRDRITLEPTQWAELVRLIREEGVGNRLG